jgi:hypothetical protein
MNSELQIIPGTTGNYTYGRDDYGEFGSLVRPESDEAIPEPLDFQPNPALDQLLES